MSAPALNAVFSSDVPRGSGLSSSASVELAFAVAWQKLGGWSLPPMQLALLGQKAENKYVGVNCGIMDQFASACGKKDRLLYLDCRSLTWETVPLPENVAIVVADTTIRRKLTSGEYNKRRSACEEAVRLLKADLPGIEALRDVSVADFNRFASQLPVEVEKRARHVVEEVGRSLNAVKLLESGNVAEFGQLMNACHVSLRDYYEVSCPELDIMVRVASKIKGCYGARLTGAGFGVVRSTWWRGIRPKCLPKPSRQATSLRPDCILKSTFARPAKGRGCCDIFLTTGQFVFKPSRWSSRRCFPAISRPTLQENTSYVIPIRPSKSIWGYSTTIFPKVSGG